MSNLFEDGKVRVYDGETARNLNIRSKEHIRDYENNLESSWMLKHVNKDHDGDKDNVKFSFKVLKKHTKPLERQLDEAVNINNKKPAENINTKYEFNSQNLTKFRLERLKENFL